jgi:endogenous inhibitor of DNA gyrase (YacG/DUF329 family)
MPPVVKCPTCGRPVAWSEASKHRPFCSERCKMIDLGAWASDRYVVPGSAAGQAEAMPATAPGGSKH